MQSCPQMWPPYGGVVNNGFRRKSPYANPWLDGLWWCLCPSHPSFSRAFATIAHVSKEQTESVCRHRQVRLFLMGLWRGLHTPGYDTLPVHRLSRRPTEGRPAIGRTLRPSTNNKQQKTPRTLRFWGYFGGIVTGTCGNRQQTRQIPNGGHGARRLRTGPWPVDLWPPQELS